MKHRKGSVKKITAMLLAVLMVVTTVQLPAPERAEASTTTCTEAGCGGTYVNGFCSVDDTHYEAPELNAEGYYEIGNAGELYWFAAHVNEGGDNLSSNAVLTADIVVNEGTMTAESTGVRKWVPIGNSVDMTFSGLFDGQGYSVSGLYFNDKTVSNVGLFGRSEGVIENVGVIESYIYGSGNVGGIVGQSVGGTIKNCYNTGAIKAEQHIGGIVGSFTGESIIDECYNGGTITCTLSTVGGIVGFVSTSYKVKIVNCYNFGNVNGGNRAGGIIGWLSASNLEIKNCYNIGDVFADTTTLGRAGAIIGVLSLNEFNTCVDCFYLAGSAKIRNNNIHNGVGGIGMNASSKATDEEGKTIPFETAALTSGEICYLLNNGVTDGTQAFYQTVGSGMPTFSGETVYYGYADCDAMEAIYANTPLNATQGHAYSADCDRSCNYCGEKREVEVTHEVQSGGLQGDIVKVKCATCKEEIGQLTISVPRGAIYDGTPKPVTLSGAIEGLELPQVQYGKIDGLPPVDAGTYTATILIGGSSLSIQYAIEKCTPYLGTVTVQAISNTLDASALQWKRTNNTVDGTFRLSGKLSYGTKSYGWTFIPTDGKNYKVLTGTVSITVRDTILPTATYQIDDNAAKSFGSVQQSGVVGKEARTVIISFADKNASGEEGSGVKSGQYYISNSRIENINQITAWSDYTAPLTLSEPGQYYIYAKVTDKQDNVFYGVSEQIVIYEDSTLVPLTATYTYKEGQNRTFTLSTEANTVKEIKDAQGNVLPTEAYWVSGKQITLKRDYLDTLNKGTYAYTVVLNPQGLTDASLEQECTFTVTVNPAVVRVVGATANNKTYDGTGTVEVTDVVLQGIRGADDVKVNVSAVQGRVAGADAGTYSTVALTGIALMGTDAGNYLLETSSASVTAMQAVVIGKKIYTDKAADRQYLYLRENVDSIDLKEFLPADCGAVSYSAPVTGGAVSWSGATVTGNGVLNYTVSAGTAGDAGTLTVTVMTRNYADFTVTVSAVLTDQKPVSMRDSSAALLQSAVLTYGENLGTLQFENVVFVDEAGNEVPGNLSWETPELVPDTAVQWASWVFTPASVEYYTVTGNVAITVNKATPYIGALPVASDIVYGETLAQSVLSGGEVWHSASAAQAVAGTFFWKNSAVAPKMSDSCVTEYAVVFIPTDGANYNSVETTVTVGVRKKSGEYTGFVERQYLYLRENSDSINLAGLLPADCGAVEYGTPVVAGGVTCPATPEINGGVLYYTINPGECNASGTITIPVTMENCQDIEIVVSILLNDRKSVYLQGSLLPFNTLTYGEPASVLTFGDVTFTDEAGNPVAGNLSWANPDYVPDAGEQYAGWVFTPDSIEYYPFSGTVRITVNKATPYVTDLPVASDIVYGETLAQSGLSGGAVTHSETVAQDVAGSFEWKDAGITPTLADSGVTGYIVVFTPVDSANYNKVETTIVLTVNPVLPDDGGEVAPEAPNEPSEPTEPNEPVDPCTHGETEVRNAVAASCIASGYTGDVHCKSCGELQVRGTVTAATGHRYTGYVAKQPTTEAEGTYVYSCMYCGSSYGETIAKLPATEPEEAEVVKIERKTSWSFITKDLKKAEEGTTFTVDMNGTTAVPLKALRAIRNKDVTLEIRITKDLVWSINGKKLPKILRGDMECGVLLNPSQEDTKTVIPKNLLRETAKGNTYVTMHLDHEGKFGFEALLSVMFGEEKEGSFANLFYFNEKAGTLEFADADKIGKDGKATFTFTHASEYVIVFADVSLEPEEPQMPEEPELKEPEVPTPDVPEEPQKPEPVVPEKKDLKQVAKEVINGRWGNGETRKKRLTEAGYDYKEVQKTVNELLK